MNDEQLRQTSETWEEYAHRLENRIKMQREQLFSLHQGAPNGNRRARKKIELLESALGRMTVRWEKVRKDFAQWMANNPYETERELADLLRRQWYSATPTDCLISETREIIMGSAVGYDIRAMFEERVAQWRAEVDADRDSLQPPDAEVPL